MVKPLTIYKASAGSGKTFTLATEYIKLVVMNPQGYRNILAVTFTNKATEEMKMRILSQLYGIWKQLPGSRNYLMVICEKTGQSEAFVSERAGQALTNLLHNYNYFRVETIDTFFQSVLRNLARELDLTANLRIGLNDYQVEEMAIDQLIEDLSTTDVMLQWLLRYIMQNISDDKSWNVIGQIKSFGKNIFKDEYKRVSGELNKKIAEPDFFENYSALLRHVRSKAEERLKQLGDTFFDTIESEGLTVDDFLYGKSGPCSIFIKLRNGIFDESIVGKRVADSVGVADKWCKKNHPRRDLILSLVESTLDRLLRTAIDERPRQWRLYKSADLTLSHLSQLRLLNSIEQKVRTLNESANRFLLSDTQQLLHALIDGSDSPFIFEKIGTQLEHVMIDEFQDTSTVQWQNFKVLLAEAMSHEGADNLIVGDVKQSIYRWRSGDWRLLNDIQSQFPEPEQQLQIRTLDTNYRSASRIIQFNNTFFHHAAEIEYLTQQSLNTQEADQLKRAYEDVTQQVPDGSKTDGLIDIRLLAGEDYQGRVLQQLVDVVSQLCCQGIAPDSIAILVRSNSFIPLIAQYFLEHLPDIRIVSDEAFRLDASFAVNLLIQALHLLAHPTDSLARANVVKIYQCQVLQNPIPDNELLMSTRQLEDLLPADYVNHTAQLLTLPLYELTEKLYQLFELHRIQEQSAYICAFYDHLFTYVNENATGIDEFISEWEENLCSKTIQSDEIDGIRLISIHKSKGLEFEHVIIPFCDWQLEKQGNTLWCQPQEAPFNQLPIAPIDYSQKQLSGTIYESDYLHEHLQNTVDNLNLLYVAFTRASRSLCVIGRRNARNSRSALIEQTLPLLQEVFPDARYEGSEDEGNDLLFCYGSLELRNVNPISKEPSHNVFLQRVESMPVILATFDNKAEFRQSNKSRDFVEGDDEDTQQQKRYIQTGSVLHQIFSTIRTTVDIDDALRQLQIEGVLYDEHISAERITTLLRKRLEDKRVADWFSGRWTLFNECTILSTDGSEVVEHRPDRVMTDGKEWIVVDFKFGSPKAEYHDQVRQYMQLLASMGHQHISGYLWFVYSNKIEEVR